MLAALLLVGFMDEWLTFFPAGTLPSIRRDLGLSYSEAGVVLGALSAGGLVGTPLGGLAADFVDRRLLSAGGAFAYAAGMLVFGVSDTFLLMTGAAFVWGAASDPFVHPSGIALAELYPDEVEQMVSRQNVLSSVGDLLSPLTIAAAIALGLEWRWLFVGGAGLMVLCGFWFLSLPPLPPGRHEDAETPLSSLLAVARDVRVLRLAVVMIAFSLLDEPFLAFVLIYLREYREVAPMAAVLVTGALIASGLVGHLAVPYLVRRSSASNLRICLGSLLVVGVAAIVLSPLWPLAPVAAALTGFAGAALYSILDARLLVIRPGQAGAVVTFASYIDSVALAYPALVGVTADGAGLFPAMMLYVAVPIAALALLLVDNRHRLPLRESREV